MNLAVGLALSVKVVVATCRSLPVAVSIRVAFKASGVPEPVPLSPSGTCQLVTTCVLAVPSKSPTPPSVTLNVGYTSGSPPSSPRSLGSSTIENETVPPQANPLAVIIAFSPGL